MRREGDTWSAPGARSRRRLTLTACLTNGSSIAPRGARAAVTWFITGAPTASLPCGRALLARWRERRSARRSASTAAIPIGPRFVTDDARRWLDRGDVAGAGQRQRSPRSAHRRVATDGTPAHPVIVARTPNSLPVRPAILHRRRWRPHGFALARTEAGTPGRDPRRPHRSALAGSCTRLPPRDSEYVQTEFHRMHSSRRIPTGAVQPAHGGKRDARAQQICV